MDIIDIYILVILTISILGIVSFIKLILTSNKYDNKREI